ncbi:MAG: TIGR03067 domain-containing protein [Planctomycetes bacterium]|nr:TIGR03067 domain-containing protein [Planctomycetota bacterium]
MRASYFVVIVVIFLGAVLNVNGQDAKTDVAKLQGEWSVIAMERRGKEAPQEAIEGSVLAVKDNKMTLQHKNDDKPREFTFTLDPTKKPAAIDLTSLKEDARDKVVPGIYKFDGKNLILCIPNGKVGERPTEFKSGGEGDNIVITLARKK